MKGTVKHIAGGMVALQTEGGLVAVRTDQELKVGAEVEFPDLERVGMTDKGTPIYKKKAEEEPEQSVQQFAYAELCYAALRLIACKSLDKDLEEVEFLVSQLAAKTRNAKESG